MSIKTAKMQIRQGSAAEWTSANTLLLLGEWGLESDTGKFKLGDGVTLWNSLSYITNPLTTQVVSAWVNFNGTGTPTIIDDYNVDSITDVATGRWIVNIDVDLANANYCCVFGRPALRASGNTIFGYDTDAAIKTVSQVAVQNVSDAANADSNLLSVTILGGV